MSESFHGLQKDDDIQYIEIKSDYSYLKIEDDKIEILHAINKNYETMKNKYKKSSIFNDETYIKKLTCSQ